jgi:hypothetical protein
LKKVKVVTGERFTYRGSDYVAGDVVEVEDHDAENYVAAGYVEEVKDKRTSRKT